MIGMTNNNTFKALFQNLKSFQIDSIEQENNTFLIGNNVKLLSHIGASFGYLHVMFSGLNTQMISVINSENNNKFTDELTQFYSEYNGFNLYSGALRIFGCGYILTPQGFKISRDSNNALPIHITIENLLYKNSNKLLIGSFGNSQLFIIDQIPYLFDNTKEVKKWGSLYECLNDLILELEKHYVDGVCVNPIKIKGLVFNKPI
jgi:hypothetical protein